MPPINVKRAATTAPTPDPLPSKISTANQGTTVPKINRGAQRPTPHKGVIECRMTFDDGSPDEFQKVEGTVYGPFGICKFLGKWSVWLMRIRRGVPCNPATADGCMALANALLHLPMHLYPNTDEMTRDEKRLVLNSPALRQLRADMERIINSKEW